MKVYHGSYIKIDEINLTKGELNRDFGRGFSKATNILPFCWDCDLVGMKPPNLFVFFEPGHLFA